MLWGITVPFLLWFVMRLPIVLGITSGSNPTDEVIVLANLAIPVGTGFAILRYRLLDIHVVLRRTLLGAGVAVVVLFLYHFIVSAFAFGFSEPAASTGWAAPVFITTLAFTLVLVPAQNLLDDALERLFNRKRHHYRLLLARLPDDLAALTTAEEAVQSVLSRVSNLMQANNVLVCLSPWVGSRRSWRVQEDRTIPADDSYPDMHNWALLERCGDLRFPESTRCDDLDNWMQRQGLDLAIPLRSSHASFDDATGEILLLKGTMQSAHKETLLGIFATSLPAGARTFAREDVDLLKTVSASLALALGRARSFETIQAMNAELEERVRLRTEELAQTRLTLFQWEKMASLGLLAAGVSHELNTPLGVVVSTTEQLGRSILQPNPKPERVQKLVSLCQNAASRAVQILRDLRSFSQPETGGSTSVDLAEVVRSTLSLLGPMLKARNVIVHEELADVPQFPGYPSLVGQTVANLLLNAAEAMPEGGEIRIKTSCREDTAVTITIEDNGPGIPPAIRDRVFEPFFTTKAIGKGTGLGLALCYTFVAQHKGRIWVEERAGGGARFQVELPLRDLALLQKL